MLTPPQRHTLLLFNSGEESLSQGRFTPSRQLEVTLGRFPQCGFDKSQRQLERCRAMCGHAEFYGAREVVLRGQLFGLRNAHPTGRSAFTRRKT
jgi:hypothetical protein